MPGRYLAGDTIDAALDDTNVAAAAGNDAELEDGNAILIHLTLLHYPGNLTTMTIAHSKITAQGQISVPAEVRKKLGVGPGSTLEWNEINDQVVVRRAGRFTSADIHAAVFAGGVPKARLSVKDGIKKHLRAKHARS